jgi:hypothetical protein
VAPHGHSVCTLRWRSGEPDKARTWNGNCCLIIVVPGTASSEKLSKLFLHSPHLLQEQFLNPDGRYRVGELSLHHAGVAVHSVPSLEDLGMQAQAWTIGPQETLQL